MNRLIKTSRKIAAAAALAALPFAAVGPMIVAPASAQTPGANIDQVVAALRGITTMRAKFTQTDRSGQTVGGVLTIKRPGRIRFEYQNNVNMLIVGDGKSLTMVDYDVQQVQRWPIRNSPLGALLDPQRDVGKYGTLKPTNSPDIVSIEVRDRERPEYGVITLIFQRDAAAPGGLELITWVALDLQNKRTTVRLSDQRYGVDVPESTFRWRDPRPKVRR